MKKSDYDFSIPHRQSSVAIILILFRTINIVFRQLLPVLFVFLLGGSGKKGDYILWAVIIISGMSMIYSIINFFRTYFYIQSDELILHTGILQHKRTSIPLARIQSINFEQNVVHQFFNVVKLKIDTAGSDKSEFEFQAMESDKAYALRNLVLTEKKLFQKQNGALIDVELVPSVSPVFTEIMLLSIKDLIKVGLTENHIKSSGLIFIFFFWIYQNLQEVGVELDEYSDEIPELELQLSTASILITVLLVISILVSMARSIIKNFDLRFLRSSRGFKVESGLFTKREVSAQDHKIQYISWSDNLLKRMIGFKDLRLNQASSSGLKTKQTLTIPGCNEGQVQGVITSLFGNTELSDFQMHSIDKRYFYRYGFIIFSIVLVVLSLAYWQGKMDALGIIAVIGLYLIGSRYIAYRKKSFGFNGELFYLRGGTFGDRAELLPIYKIQAVEMHQSPYQSKNELCSISLYTASGTMKIPYISEVFGRHITDIFLRKVESDKRRWM